MKRTICGGSLLIGVASALLLVIAGAPAGARTEAVLSWDDGVMDDWSHAITGRPGQMIAVMFQAPEWACWITEIHYYITDGALPDPTESFLVHVWEPAEGAPTLPGDPVNIGVNSGEGYPTDAWLEVALPEAVDLTDGTAFPDGVFFVGLEWVTRYNPFLGEDHSDPIDHMSWYFNWAVWELRESGDTMIRAVVSDTLTSPVEAGSWSQIKALFR
jgi:hypothetical protein